MNTTFEPDRTLGRGSVGTSSLAVRARTASERVGHASLAITLNIYSHAVPVMQADAAGAVVALVGLD